jgi:succinyldiaminopimelate transaminase
VVVIPQTCYPTYELGAHLAGARVVRSDAPHTLDPDLPVALVWLNSPGNPDGRVRDAHEMRAAVSWARTRGAVVASDECYLTLPWERQPISVLAPEVSGDTLDGVIAVHSLSKRSNLAGYRAGFIAGDPDLVREMLAIRKHSGLMVPAAVQAAMAAALDDEDHAVRQRERYGARRATLRAALDDAGMRVDHSHAGLYLWATRGEDCWSTVDWFAERGILVAAGSFYGPSGGQHVRVALTATDERIEAAAKRLAE